jgi:hypothetical protein
MTAVYDYHNIMYLELEFPTNRNLGISIAKTSGEMGIGSSYLMGTVSVFQDE